MQPMKNRREDGYWMSVEEWNKRKEEYNFYKQRTQTLQRELDEKKAKNFDLQNQNSYLQSQSNQTETVRDKQVKELQIQNQDLKRIAVERSNAARGITPKKKHEGYLILEQREIHKRDSVIWRMLIQTPYPSYTAKSSIRDDCLKVVNKICGNKEGEDFYAGDTSFIANHRLGFWEVEVFTYNKTPVTPDLVPPVGILKAKAAEKDSEQEEKPKQRHKKKHKKEVIHIDGRVTDGV